MVLELRSRAGIDKMPRKKPRKPQGGYKQKLAQAMADSEPEAPEGRSFLAKALLEKWAWGVLSPPQVQEIAHGAFNDGLTQSQVKQLASIGSWGQFPGNMQRDMMPAPTMQARPELRARKDLAKLVPIAIHGDGVAYMQLRCGGKTLEASSS